MLTWEIPSYRYYHNVLSVLLERTLHFTNICFRFTLTICFTTIFFSFSLRDSLYREDLEYKKWSPIPEPTCDRCSHRHIVNNTMALCMDIITNLATTHCFRNRYCQLTDILYKTKETFQIDNYRHFRSYLYDICKSHLVLLTTRVYSKLQ